MVALTVWHVPYTFFPDPSGGTEVHVDGLARALTAQGVHSLVVAPGRRAEAYDYHGLPVRRFLFSDHPTLRDLYGEGDPVAAAAFGQLLDAERPTLVHLHAKTPAVSLRLLREVTRRGLPAVLTYLSPTVTCERGTLLRWGHELCDGRLDLDRCTRCTLHHLGTPRLLAELVGRIPVGVGTALGAVGARGGAWTALRLRALMAERMAATRAFLHELTQIIVVCEWSRDLLLGNQVPAAKITLCRHGVMTPPPRPPAAAPAASLRAVWMGRFDPTKGPHLLVEALRRQAALPLVLDLFGVTQGPRAMQYEARLRDAAVGDSRIRFHPPIPAAETMARLQTYDLLAVPSQWLEAGPLIVLEAFAAGVPVVGSRLGGIAELVRDGVDGLLVEPPGSVAAWGAALRRVCDDRTLLPCLRAGIPPARTMEAVAAETAALYRRLVRP